MNAETQAAKILEGVGLKVLARRLRTPFGEIDLIVADAEWVIAVEVKQRKTLKESAEALSQKQSQRLLAAFDYVLSVRPEWGRPNTRFDLVVVDQKGRTRRIQDALRAF
ncbi:YraN family protein [Gluconobacter wancherniae]|uniref:YraN family protein n=1 Tax=Gluconobacter wancherniae TaxID=1307955 RepID=UPI0011BE95B5|nr:YraN family protein [Gluconobacter wancherniae]MBF0853445.1 YraN family protein [Gluconobacter wancherniae]